MSPKPRKPTRHAAVLLGEDAGYLRLPEVLTLFPVAERSWWKGIATGKYPQPVRLSTRTVAWKVSDIRQLLASVEERQAS
jgi:prophage regulatory protein